VRTAALSWIINLLGTDRNRPATRSFTAVRAGGADLELMIYTSMW
jgi:hypothetical protein